MLPGFAHTGVPLLGSEGECSEVLPSCGCIDPPYVCRAGHRSSSPGECIEVQVSLEGSMKNACNSHPVPSPLHLAPVIPYGDSFFFFLWKQEVLTSFLKGNESIALFLVDHYNYNDLFPAITGQRSSKTFPGNHSCRSQENLCLPLLYVWQNKPHPLWKPKLITPASLVTCFFACSIDTNDQPIATDEFHGTLCFLQAEAFFGN